MLEKVYATTVNLSISDPVSNFSTLGNLFGFILNLAIGIGWALVFIMLALGFIQYIMSKGEKAAVDSAQKWLTYAVIGGVGLFFLSFIKRIIPTLLTGNSAGPTTGGNLTDF